MYTSRAGVYTAAMHQLSIHKPNVLSDPLITKKRIKFINHEYSYQSCRYRRCRSNGYSLLFRLASGAVFGPSQPISLNLIEIEPGMPALEGVAMELSACAFPLLQDVILTSDLDKGFTGVNWALLVGSVPRKAGMERKDLLGINGKIVTGQGKAIQKNAASDVRILVVGNPCNTNCYIAMNNAKDIPSDRWFAMTRLDESRAKAQLAKKAGVPVSQVSNLVIWGNHSATQYPDFYNARIQGKPATDLISDEAWLKGEFITTVQQRGAAIIKARGASSAASAANAALSTVASLSTPTHPTDWTSVAVCSDGSYGIEKGLICSMPIRVDNKGWNVVQGLEINDFSRSRIDASVAELKEEAAAVADLIEK
jgi:malate dehydrogenase